jgi:hypothetical protein
MFFGLKHSPWSESDLFVRAMVKNLKFVAQRYILPDELLNFLFSDFLRRHWDGPRHVFAPARLIIWRPFKPLFFLTFSA